MSLSTILNGLVVIWVVLIVAAIYSYLTFERKGGGGDGLE